MYSKSKKQSPKPETLGFKLPDNGHPNRYQEVELKGWRKSGISWLHGSSKKKKPLVTDPNKIAVLERSIPRLKRKTSFRINGGFFLFLIAICATALFSGWLLAFLRVDAIGLGSSTKGSWDNIVNKIFFFVQGQFWSSFVFKNGANFYGFFSALTDNITSASDQNKFYFAIGFYVGFFSALIQLTSITLWLIISIFQKNSRNFWICLFCLLPIISIFVSVYYLGVLHYENTYLLQRLINKPLPLETKPPADQTNSNNEFYFPEINGEAFSYANPIGNLS